MNKQGFMSQRTKWIIGLASLLALSIIFTPIIYYWNDFHNNGRSENPSDWGPFGDFFGGILNPIISFLTLIVTIVIAWELKKIDDKNNERQISASYQPQLVIESFTFYVYPSAVYGGKLPTEFSAENKGHGNISDLFSPNSFTVDVYNIGLGSAKDIEFKFSTEIRPMLHVIENMSKSIPEDNRIKFTYGETGNINYVDLEFPPTMSSARFTFSLTDFPNKLTHLLNAATSPNPYKLKLPHYYLTLYGIYLYNYQELMNVATSTKNVKLIENINFPPISLKVNYFDIGMKAFEKNFNISLQVGLRWKYESWNYLTVEEIKT